MRGRCRGSFRDGTVKLSSLAAFSPLAATAKSLILSLLIQQNPSAKRADSARLDSTGAGGPAPPTGPGRRGKDTGGGRVRHQPANPLPIPAHRRLTMTGRSLWTPGRKACLSDHRRLPRQQLQPGGGRHRTLEYSLPGTSGAGRHCGTRTPMIGGEIHLRIYLYRYRNRMILLVC